MDRVLDRGNQDGYAPILWVQDLPSEVRAVEAVVEGHGFTVRLAAQDGSGSSRTWTAAGRQTKTRGVG